MILIAYIYSATFLPSLETLVMTSRRLINWEVDLLVKVVSRIDQASLDMSQWEINVEQI